MQLFEKLQETERLYLKRDIFSTFYSANLSIKVHGTCFIDVILGKHTELKNCKFFVLDIRDDCIIGEDILNRLCDHHGGYGMHKYYHCPRCPYFGHDKEISSYSCYNQCRNTFGMITIGPKTRKVDFIQRYSEETLKEGKILNLNEEIQEPDLLEVEILKVNPKTEKANRLHSINNFNLKARTTMYVPCKVVKGSVNSNNNQYQDQVLVLTERLQQSLDTVEQQNAIHKYDKHLLDKLAREVEQIEDQKIEVQRKYDQTLRQIQNINEEHEAEIEQLNDKLENSNVGRGRLMNTLSVLREESKNNGELVSRLQAENEKMRRINLQNVNSPIFSVSRANSELSDSNENSGNVVDKNRHLMQQHNNHMTENRNHFSNSSSNSTDTCQQNNTLPLPAARRTSVRSENSSIPGNINSNASVSNETTTTSNTTNSCSRNTNSTSSNSPIRVPYLISNIESGKIGQLHTDNNDQNNNKLNNNNSLPPSPLTHQRLNSNNLISPNSRKMFNNNTFPSVNSNVQNYQNNDNMQDYPATFSNNANFTQNMLKKKRKSVKNIGLRIYAAFVTKEKKRHGN